MKKQSITRLLGAGLIMLGGWAHGATLTVTTTADTVADDGQCSLREAIMNANTNSQSGSIDCVAGDYESNTIVFDPSLAHATLTLNGTQLPNLSRVLVIEGPVPGDPTGLTLDADLASRLIRINGTDIESSQVTLRYLTLTGGRLTSTGTSGYGGAVSVVNASLLLEQVVLSHNSTAGNGGRGGGLHGRQSRIELVDSVVEHNHTEGIGATGGGIQVEASELSLVRSQVRENQTAGASANGGGLWAGTWGTSNGSEVSIMDSVIADNATQASTTFGGGLYTDSSQVLIRRSTIASNSTTASGGGIFVNEGHLDLINSTVSSNFGNATGGLRLNRSNAALLHSTVAFNWASGAYASDIGLFGMSADPTSLSLVNSLVVQENAGRRTCSVNDHSTIINIGSSGTHESCVGEAVASAQDLRLMPLAGYGGPVPTHGLDTGSLAIDFAGDCQAEFGIDRDQRGRPRPGANSGGCDAGAFEFQPGDGDALFSDRFAFQ